MGLSASQARLLTITTRKSDCEFQSMRYSHQKIALSRDLTDISNEYQDSLNATKLVYDFYATGDDSISLTYSMMMTPSELNKYSPMLLTNTANRVLLDEKFAAAAEAAGIPKEGLGTLPSTTVRDMFIEALTEQGLITENTKDICLNNQYNQEAGLGASDYMVTIDTTGSAYINGNNTLTSSFYDALFNQLCMRGWARNDSISDKDYLQNMYQNSKIFLTTCSEDGYYYQESYGQNNYIREVSDEDAIAKAEAKYNTEKQKINQKEEVIDLKMKRLDTEISSLTTEYDTVKSLISKNIERSFKRYDA